MSINIATKGMFPGTPMSMATSGKFKGSLVIIKGNRTFVSKNIKYFFISKNTTEK